MRTARGRSARWLVVASALAVTMNGCAVGFRSFSIDSTSRMPFMGFELKERKAKSSAPVYKSISRTEVDCARIEPVVQTETTTSRNILNLSLKNPFSTKANGASSGGGGTQQSAPPPVSVAIPLAATQGTFSAIERKSNSSELDFQ